MPDHFTSLAAALRERLATIADRDLFQRDPAAHLDKLKSVSEKIDRLAGAIPRPLDPNLAHYLQRASYQKALDWIEARQS